MRNIEPSRQQAHIRLQVLDRLRTAAARLTDAQLERTWAVVAAHEQGFSIRQIAIATGLSATRVHQLLGDPHAQQIPRRLSRLRESQESSPDPAEITPRPEDNLNATWLDAEVSTLRQCICWLEQLEGGELVVVNLRLETDPVSEFVRFDGERIRRVLGRIAADLEAAAQRSRGASVAMAGESDDALARHRLRLAEPLAQLRRRSLREERNDL